MIVQQKTLAAEQGQRISDLRAKTHLTRRTFAARHHISASTLQNWESGRYQGLGLSAVETLVAAFKREGIHCTTDWILYGKGPEPFFHEHLHTSSQASNPLTIEAERNAQQLEQNEKFYRAVENGRHAEAMRFIKQGLTLHLKSGFAIHFHDNNENTPLHVAASIGHIELVKSLLRHNADPNAVNRQLQTPLHIAVACGHKEIIKYLISHGAKIDAKENEGDTPLAWAAYTGQSEALIQLCELGAQINAQNNMGNTPIYWAAYKGFLDIVEILIKEGGNYKIANNQNETPLQIAVKAGRVNIVEFLLDLEAN